MVSATHAFLPSHLDDEDEFPPRRCEPLCERLAVAAKRDLSGSMKRAARSRYSRKSRGGGANGSHRRRLSKGFSR